MALQGKKLKRTKLEDGDQQSEISDQHLIANNR